jgi:sugar O-acyltransferase (sialic acid O-acetyltransferase NeuD family)
MKNLILIGAGDWGQEVHSWIHESIQYGVEYIFKGFIDDNVNILANSNLDSNLYLGSVNSYLPEENDVFICTIANLKYKEKAIHKIFVKGGRFVNAFHKSVCFIGKFEIGYGVILSPFVAISNNCKIGNHIGINLFCSIGHDVIIGDYSQLSAHCDLTGHVVLGNNVFLGSRVSIIPSVNIVSNSVLGAGAVIFRNIKIPGTYIGNPAKKLDQ